MIVRIRLLALCLLALPAIATTAQADVPPPPGPAEPLQTRPGQDRGAWLLQGWARTVSGTSGQGKTSLVVDADPDDDITLTVGETKTTQKHPADFELPNEDQTVTVFVEDPRGATWEGTVVVPKGMRMTLDLKANYEHRGYLGTVKFTTRGCKALPWARKNLRFDVTQAGAPVTPYIELEPGKSAPGVRLKIGSYKVLVSEKYGRDWREVDTVPLDVKAADWRFEYGCAE